MSNAVSTRMQKESGLLSSTGPTRMSLRRRYSFGRCPSCLPRRGDAFAVSFEGSSNVPRFSRPRVPRLDGASRPRNDTRHLLNKRGRPLYTPSLRKHLKGTGALRCKNASSTTAKPATPETSSTSIDAARATATLAATIHTAVGVTIEGRTATPHPSHWALWSSAKPYTGLCFQPFPATGQYHQVLGGNKARAVAS